MAAKHKRRKGKNASVTSVAEDKLDRGTLQTRARISPDPASLTHTRTAAIAMDLDCGGQPEVMCLPAKKEA